MEIAKKEFEYLLESGICQRSKSQWSSPLHMVQKSNGSWRPCGNYRRLNAKTIPDNYPVRHIQDFGGDLHETPPKRFNDLSETVKGLPFVFPYLDDVLIASTSEAEHVEHLEQLFRRCRERGLVINEEKCQLGQSEVEFLGHLVSSKGIRPLTHSLTRRFLPHAAATEAPLQRLMGACKKRDQTSISWTPEATEAFQKLKEQLANAALIAFPLRDHKPLMHAFDQKWEKLSPRQTRQLNYISQFSSDIRHISGADNHVANMLSRTETFALPSPIDMQHLHDEQSNSDELKELLNGGPTSLHLVQYHHPDTGINIVCDESIGTLRPYVPESLRQVVFNANHGLAHPGAKATIKLISRNFVWKRMSSDLRARVRSCPACQRCKVACHTKGELETFAVPGKVSSTSTWT
ncbi:uncharacterized protein LOC118736110 [Rhagoletis pomonella]|uniref:uncharacterized protein LOC118736110 n=1 Tax=Rhagoletis pomonella TaxID=28610 RepID=UPI0017855080|nr:uncharacterized protein LOC118736110 [Rhagoletis pomonella]